VDGAIAGVGSVVVFLPQILILFAFIILLEDTGYMPRVAFLIDRLMRLCGLSGQSFIPMLSSFACAVPGIMATRVIPERRDRLATILAAPFMTCSARLPVYALMIGAFIPNRHFLGGTINLQGLVLLGLYLLGIVAGVFTALLMKRTALRGPTPTFLIELPPYRLPNLRSVLLRLLERGRIFVTRAGTVIFTVAVVIWSLAYFPRPDPTAGNYESQRVEATATLRGYALAARLRQVDNAETAANLESSYLGRMGKLVAPVFAPLGWDWKVSAAVIAGFPAREVVVAALGTIYAVGSDAASNDNALIERLRAATWPDGRLVFTMPMAIGLLIFYAFCLQCAATIAMIRRETNSWTWPAFAWVYMTGMGYFGAMLAFQLGS
jgi:ferrous iron transport protein B